MTILTEHVSAPRLGERHPDGVAKLFSRFNCAGSPGLAVIVVEGGNAVYTQGFGEANIGHGIPWTPHVRHHVASISKQFIAALALKLHHQGRLDLDAPIGEHLPELGRDAAQITTRQILTHQGGLRVDEPMLELAGLVGGLARSTLKGLFDLVARQPRLNFQPGDFYEYNDAGSRLACWVAERATGVDITKLSRDELFAPLGMACTDYVISWADSVPGGSEVYFEQPNGGWRRLHMNLESSGDGGVVSTATDLARWWEQYRSNSLGIPDFERTMSTPVPLSGGRLSFYGLGWNCGTHRGLRYFYHTGTTNSVMLCLPEVDVCVVITANREIRRATAGFHVFDALYPELETAGLPFAQLAFPGADAAAHHKPGSAYVNPDDGAFLDVSFKDDAALATLIGEHHFLRETSDGWWRTEDGATSLALRLDASGYLEADRGADPVRFVPTEWDWLSGDAADAWAGTYFCDDIRASIVIEPRGDRMIAMLGCGTHPDAEHPLRVSSAGTLAGPWFALAAESRADGGRVEAITANMTRLRQMSYRRIA